MPLEVSYHSSHYHFLLRLLRFFTPRAKYRRLDTPAAKDHLALIGAPIAHKSMLDR